jgi:phosphoglycolate phosphatase
LIANADDRSDAMKNLKKPSISWPAESRDNRGVVFDLDGTLVDSRDDIVQAVEFALRRHGHAVPSADVIASYVGDGARLLVARALGVAADDASVGPVLETFVAFYEAHPVDHTRPMPGALDALDALRGVPLALCTNKPRRITLEVISRLGLADRFSCVVAGGDVTRQKPHEEALLSIGAELGLSPSRLAMVGDGPQDVECGRAAGAYTVAVAGGFASTERLRTADPDILITGLSELVPALFVGRS